MRNKIISGVIIGVISGLVVFFASYLIMKPQRLEECINVLDGRLNKLEGKFETFVQLRNDFKILENKVISVEKHISETSQNGYYVTIDQPQNNSNVGSQTIAWGTAYIPDSDHLWILVRRVDFEPLWWPQREVTIDQNTHNWSATIYFGQKQDINWDFHIGLVTVNSDEHRRLMDYWTNSMRSNDWKPINVTETTSSPTVIKVSKVSH